MHISVLCSAGLAITCREKTLLVDLPNENFPPFYALTQAQWEPILNRTAPYETVYGLYFTHTHPDHYDQGRVEAYRAKWPETLCFVPEAHPDEGVFTVGPFTVSYRRLDHAPMDGPVPPHVVSWIETGEKRLYVAADAKLDPEAHRAFLKGRRADAAFWNSMYLSRTETRQLLRETAERNYIYHMPQTRPDGFGLWKKCENNCRRYAGELAHVTVIDHYPWEIEI